MVKSRLFEKREYDLLVIELSFSTEISEALVTKSNYLLKTNNKLNTFRQHVVGMASSAAAAHNRFLIGFSGVCL